jgi:RNA polymerase sigma factor (sigma-70 family)
LTHSNLDRAAAPAPHAAPTAPDSAARESASAHRRAPPRQQLPLFGDEGIADLRRELHRRAVRRVVNRTDVEDIVQDALLDVVRQSRHIAAKQCPRAWCMGILRNKVGNYYRKHRLERHHAGEGDAPPPRLDAPPPRMPPSPEDELLRKELEEVVAAAIDRLPRMQRLVMELSIDGAGPGEIARDMAPARYQSVINHLHRGRRRLALDLERYGAGAPGGMHGMKRSRGRSEARYSEKTSASKT